MRITSKGQVTIPQQIRERAGLMPGTDVEFVLVETAGTTPGVEVRLRKAEAVEGRPTRGRRLVQTLAGQGDFAMSTDEVIASMRGPCADEENETRDEVDG